jgi:hypothetical protein
MYDPKHTILIIAKPWHDKELYALHRVHIGQYDGEEIELNVVEHKPLPDIRRICALNGLQKLERSMGDDPTIIERWI